MKPPSPNKVQLDKKLRYEWGKQNKRLEKHQKARQPETEEMSEHEVSKSEGDATEKMGHAETLRVGLAIISKAKVLVKLHTIESQ